MNSEPGSLLLGTAGEIVSAGPRWTQALGLAPEQLVGERLVSLATPGMRGRVRALVRQLHDARWTGEPFDLALQDTRGRTIRARGATWCDHGRSGPGVIGDAVLEEVDLVDADEM